MADGVRVLVSWGDGLTVMVYEDKDPVHSFASGVMVMTATIGSLVRWVAVKEGIFPVPLAPSPMAVLLLTHVKEVPATGPVTCVTGTVTPWHHDWFEMGFAVGEGFTPTVTV